MKYEGSISQGASFLTGKTDGETLAGDLSGASRAAISERVGAHEGVADLLADINEQTWRMVDDDDPVASNWLNERITELRGELDGFDVIEYQAGLFLAIADAEEG